MLPMLLPVCCRAGLAVAVLSLGELGASKLVKPAGSETFAHEIFEKMHFGVTNDLAALCLVLLVFVVLGGLVLACLDRWHRFVTVLQISFHLISDTLFRARRNE
jgi:ABC-type spermidine/putrescine transport system permease subunit II